MNNKLTFAEDFIQPYGYLRVIDSRGKNLCYFKKNSYGENEVAVWSRYNGDDTLFNFEQLKQICNELEKYEGKQ